MRFPIPPAEFRQLHPDDLVRRAEIVSTPHARGIFEGTRATWDRAVARNEMPKPVLAKGGAPTLWRAGDVLAALQARLEPAEVQA